MKKIYLVFDFYKFFFSLEKRKICMLTNIENNIKLNFFNYVKQYVNSICKLQLELL
jgi:hypothetical protein